MSDQAPTATTNLDIYGSVELPWHRPRGLLAAPPRPAMPGGDHPSFLGTTRPDGRPHAAGIGARWHDGDLSFTSGPVTRKSRNLTDNPACTIAMSLKGIDLVLEGEAVRVSDNETLNAVAALFRQEGWPAEVEGTVFGVATEEPYGATRWRFDR